MTVTELIAVIAEIPWRSAMARIARIVVPGLPHHITQRGNRREQVFFSDEDYLAYIDLLAQALETSELR